MKICSLLISLSAPFLSNAQDEKELSAKDAKKDPSAKAEIAGAWTVSTETPQGKTETALNITKSGDSYSGRVSGGRLTQPVDLTKVELDGNALKYTYSFTVGIGQSISVEVEAIVEGDTFKGTATAGQFGSFPVEAKKDPK